MTIQTVAVFHAGASVVSAWNCAEGIVQTLEGMGFQTIDCGNPQQRLVDIELLKQVDLIILSGLEWYEPLIKQVYGARWLDIAAPKIAWYAESFHRDDREFYYSRTAMLADIHYFPAVQDAIEAVEPAKMLRAHECFAFRRSLKPRGNHSAACSPKTPNTPISSHFMKPAA